MFTFIINYLENLIMKHFFYMIIKHPLKLIFLKTPLIKILKKRFKSKRFKKKNNIVWSILDYLFQKEYFNKIQNKYEIRELIESTVVDGEGRKWATHYYQNHFKTLEDLKKTKTGDLYNIEAIPLFENIIKFIKTNKLEQNDNTYIIQVGSSSGRDLEFFINQFPKLNYISTDISDEILDFQKEKYNYPNLKYFKCYAEDIDDCINHFGIKNKNIILFSSGSLQYVHPLFIENFFKKVKNINNCNLFLTEPVNLKLISNKKNLISDNRGKISFSHLYNIYAKNLGVNIIDYKIIKPYSNNHKQHKTTSHFYLHSCNKF